LPLSLSSVVAPSCKSPCTSMTHCLASLLSHTLFLLPLQLHRPLCYSVQEHTSSGPCMVALLPGVLVSQLSIWLPHSFSSSLRCPLPGGPHRNSIHPLTAHTSCLHPDSSAPIPLLPHLVLISCMYHGFPTSKMAWDDFILLRSLPYPQLHILSTYNALHIVGPQ
jgi:hypothetical protein